MLNLRRQINPRTSRVAINTMHGSVLDWADHAKRPRIFRNSRAAYHISVRSLKDQNEYLGSNQYHYNSYYLNLPSKVYWMTFTEEYNHMKARGLTMGGLPRCVFDHFTGPMFMELT